MALRGGGEKVFTYMKTKYIILYTDNGLWEAFTKLLRKTETFACNAETLQPKAQRTAPGYFLKRQLYQYQIGIYGGIQKHHERKNEQTD